MWACWLRKKEKVAGTTAERLNRTSVENMRRIGLFDQLYTDLGSVSTSTKARG